MKTVYNLVMIDKESSYDQHLEGFNIGFFSTREKAKKTAKRYLNEVNGFKDYLIDYHITEKCVIGSADDFKMLELYIVYGWNENDELDEIDEVESDCYTTPEDAEQELNAMKDRFCRKEWNVAKYTIDECCWQEGFVKEYC